MLRINLSDQIDDLSPDLHLNPTEQTADVASPKLRVIRFMQEHSSKNSHRKRRVLNPKAAVIVGVVLACAVFGVRKLHGKQYEKTVQFLRSSSMQAIEQQNYTAGVNLLSQYLSMRRGDLEARETMSTLLMDHVGTGPAIEQAYRINEDLLRDSGAKTDLRLRQVRLALRLSRYSDAQAHLTILQSALPNLSEVWLMSGQVAVALRKPDDAARFFRIAVRCPSPQPAAYIELIAVMTQQNAGRENEAEADKLLQEMIQKVPTAEAFAHRAAWRLSHKQTMAAVEDVWEGLQRDPDFPRLNSLLVHCCQKLYSDEEDQREALTQRAIRHFEQLNQQEPQPRHILNQATLLWLTGNKTDTIAVLEEGVRQAPRAFAVHRLLVEYLLNDNRVAQAKEVLDHLPAQALNESDSAYLNGRVLLAEEKWKPAAELLTRAIAFADKSSSTLPRAQIALAMAQRYAGSRVSTMNAYRSVLTSNPKSIDGRLGMAATLVDSQQLELAIAEYKQLIHVPGVAPYLVSLMIEHNLKLRPALRRWDDVHQMLKDDAPVPIEPVQRVLLKADLNLAMGKVTEALHLLDISARQYPSSPQIQNAIGRLNGELASQLRDRLQLILVNSPQNIEAHAALIRLYLAADETELAAQWIDDVIRGRECAELGETAARQVMIAAIQTTAQWEQNAGHLQHLAWLNTIAVRQCRELARQSSDHVPLLVRQLTLAEQYQEAFSTAQDVAAVSRNLAAISCLNIVRFANNRTAVQREAERQLYLLIQAAPADMSLRTAYAEMLLFKDDLSTASQVLSQVINHDNNQAFAAARLAWIQVVSTDDAPPLQTQMVDQRTVQQMNDALSRDPYSSVIRDLNYRLLLAQGKFRQVAAELNAVAKEEKLSSASMVYRAACLLQLGDTDQALLVCLQIRDQISADPLLPADNRLFEAVLAGLSVPATALR